VVAGGPDGEPDGAVGPGAGGAGVGGVGVGVGGAGTGGGIGGAGRPPLRRARTWTLTSAVQR
jgi:hypothetical protein